MEHINNIVNAIASAFAIEQGSSVVMQVFVMVFITLIASFFANKFLLTVEKKLKKTKTPWDDAVVESARKPIQFLVWIIGLTFAAQLIDQGEDIEIFKAIAPLRTVGIIASLSWFVIRFIKYIEKHWSYAIKHGETKLDETTAGAIVKLLRITVYITTGLIIIETLGFNISGVLAFGGIGGVAVGFASQDLLSNFFGAMMIYMDKPFRVGDWIRSPDKNIEGTVEDIGWRMTKIRTFDKRPLYVPNSTFTKISIENPSRMSNRRFYETIGVRYDDMSVVDKITTDVKKMLQKHEEIDQKQTMIVNVNAFGPSSVDFFVYTFTKTTNWIRFHEIKEDLMLRIAKIIDKHKAEIAFPTTTLHVPEAVGVSTVKVNKK